MLILHNLKSMGSNLMKEEILRNASELDRKVFSYAYDPYKMYYQKFKTEDVDWDSVREPEDSMFKLLDALSSRAMTGAAARSAVVEYSDEHGDLIKLICNKDLSCGVSIVTLNKVFGRSFIPKFTVQLAEAEDIKNVRVPIAGQIKYNGTRVVARWDGSMVVFKTRNGHSFEFPELHETLRGTAFRHGVWDGELCFGDSQGRNHAEISGIVNSAIKGTPIRGGRGIVYNVFDFMSLEHFDANECPKTYRERYHDLQYSFLPSSTMKVAETFEFATLDEIQAKFNEVLEMRYEGLILKQWDHLYKFRRSKDWIKLKAEKTVTLSCLNIIPGEGKYVGMIGALQCEGMAEGKHVIVDVGTGLSDEDRARDPVEYVGKKIDIVYNEVIANKRDINYMSLFLPRFICVRGDL